MAKTTNRMFMSQAKAKKVARKNKIWLGVSGARALLGKGCETRSIASLVSLRYRLVKANKRASGSEYAKRFCYDRSRFRRACQLDRSTKQMSGFAVVYLV